MNLDLDLPSPDPRENRGPLQPQLGKVTYGPNQGHEVLKSHMGGFLEPGKPGQPAPGKTVEVGLRAKPRDGESVLEPIAPGPEVRRPPGDLKRRAQRDYDRARDQLQNFLLGPECREVKESDSWGNLYYSTSSLKKFDAQVAAFEKAHPHLAPAMRLRADLVRAQMVALEEARRIEKAELEARRERRARAAEEKKSFGGVKRPEMATLETYQALRVGLNELEAQVREACAAGLQGQMAAVLKKLDEHQGRFDLAFPRSDFRKDRHDVLAMKDGARTRARRWVSVEQRTYDGPEIATAKPDNADRIRADATRTADEVLAQFSAKLAGKIDRDKAPGFVVQKVAYRGGVSPGAWSTLEVELARGEEKARQVWETKTIVNRSVYDRIFNQWPTRRVDADAPQRTEGDSSEA